MRTKVVFFFLVVTVLFCVTAARGNDSKVYHIGVALGLTAGPGYALRTEFSEMHTAYFTFFPYYNSRYNELFLSAGVMYQNVLHRTDIIDLVVGAGAALYHVEDSQAICSSPALGVVIRLGSFISLSLMLSNPVMYALYDQSLTLLPMADVAFFYRINRTQ